MAHPEKWRDTCDPFGLNYHRFQPESILGYPHAGNDVFQMAGKWDGKPVFAYVKVPRHDADSIRREYELLCRLDAPVFPRILDADFGEQPYLVTEALPGQRLSVLLGENEEMESLNYMEAYGAFLGEFHSLAISAEPAPERRFFHRPDAALLEKLALPWLARFLDSKPKASARVFCHGDFHYANILWQEKKIRGVLDFELSGMGDRDFDIAWALIRRPGQKFLKTEEERERFLRGYCSTGSCNPAAIRYYMAQIYVYFLSFSREDGEYCQYVRNWLLENCK